MSEPAVEAPAYDHAALHHTMSARPKLVRGLQFEYVPFEWDGTNSSGFQPFGKNVIIGVDLCPEVTGGGIMLPDAQREVQDANSITGTIVAIGAEAFRFFDDGTPWIGEKLAVGDRITFEKYAGVMLPGDDDRAYRIFDYRAVAAKYVGHGEGATR